MLELPDWRTTIIAQWPMQHLAERWKRDKVVYRKRSSLHHEPSKSYVAEQETPLFTNASMLLWLAFLLALGRYEATYPEQCSNDRWCPEEPRGFRDIIVRHEVRPVVLCVFAAEAALGVFTEQVESHWRTGRVSRRITPFTVMSVGRYALLALSIVYDPRGHEAANDTCFGAAMLLDFLSFATAFKTFLSDADDRGFPKDILLGFLAMFYLFIYGVIWGTFMIVQGSARFAEWFVLGLWIATDAVKKLSLECHYEHLNRQEAKDASSSGPLELDDKADKGGTANHLSL